MIRAFKLSDETWGDVQRIAAEAGMSPSAVVELMFVQLRAFGLDRIDWARLRDSVTESKVEQV